MGRGVGTTTGFFFGGAESSASAAASAPSLGLRRGFVDRLAEPFVVAPFAGVVSGPSFRDDAFGALEGCFDGAFDGGFDGFDGGFDESDFVLAVAPGFELAGFEPGFAATGFCGPDFEVAASGSVGEASGFEPADPDFVASCFPFAA